MRIPSQFNEDNLYRRGSRRNNSTDALRRIIRMVVALVLLIVVMQYVAKPRLYEVFFGQGESTAETVGLVSDDFQAALVATQKARVADSPVPESCRQMATELTAGLAFNEQRQWAAVLARWNAGKPFPLMGSLVSQSVQVLDEITDADQEQRQAWKRTLTTFGEIYSDSELVTEGQVATDPVAATQKAPPAELTDQDAVRLVAWFNALDAAALGRVVDGSVWRSADFDAFYLQLDQADSLSREGSVTAAVVPLLQQPDVYRGQVIRVSGVIARADRMDASANPHSIDEYWQLWIRPDSGGDRPMVFIVPGLPAKLKETIAGGGQPQSRFVGRFFKRLAYRSQAGADLAPVVIGRVDQPASSPKATRAAAAKNKSMSDKNRFLITLLIASVIGVSLAVIAMWRTSVAAGRARQLRARQQQPSEFLDDLSRTNLQSEVESES